MTELTGNVTPDAEAARANLRRGGTPSRVFYMELFLDAEVKTAVTERFGLMDGVSRDDPHYLHKREIAVQQLLGYDWVYTGLAVSLTFKHDLAPDNRRARPRRRQGVHGGASRTHHLLCC